MSIDPRRRLADRVTTIGATVVCAVVLVAGIVILGPEPDPGPQRIDGLDLDDPGSGPPAIVSDVRIPHRRLETTTTTEETE